MDGTGAIHLKCAGKKGSTGPLSLVDISSKYLDVCVFKSGFPRKWSISYGRQNAGGMKEEREIIEQEGLSGVEDGKTG